MSKFLIRRFIFLFATILFTSLIVFFITQYLPGDVARVILGREAGEAQLEALRVKLGLNDPLTTQYLRWLGSFFTGDWGIAFSTNTAIKPLVLGRFRNSMMLAALTLVIAVPVSVGLRLPERPQRSGVRHRVWREPADQDASRVCESCGPRVPASA